MNSRPRLATFSLLLFLTACFLCWTLWATDERTAAGPLGESFAARNSAGLSQAAKPGQAAGRKSPANKTGPLFVVIQNGRYGYIDKTGKMVILAYRLRVAEELERDTPKADILSKIGPRPWDVLNETFQAAEFPYRVVSPMCRQ
jgi:hypothetical protein